MLSSSQNLNEAILKELPEREQTMYRMVFDAVKNHELLTDQLRTDNEAERTFGERMADAVAKFGGSWAFIGTFLLIMTAWMVINVVLLANKGFDPYPFILLNLVLSCVAALQAPIIMMSQNRKDQRDRHRAEDDYLINLKAEIEIRHIHQKMEEIAQTQIELGKKMGDESQAMLQSLKMDTQAMQATLAHISNHLGLSGASSKEVTA